MTSELAGHIAGYGRWLQGCGEWRNKALVARGEYNGAAEAKRRRISRLSEAVSKHWSRLTPDFRRRNLMALRREKQRLQLLQAGMAVPPTLLLDMRADNHSFRYRFNEHILASKAFPEFFREWLGQAELV
jgi:hypothetical protein